MKSSFLARLAVILPLAVGCLALTTNARADAPPEGAIGVQLRTDQDTGEAVVQAVVADAPAAKAGIKEGDVFLKVAANAVKGAEEAVKEIGKYKPGDKVKILLKRDGKEQIIEVTVGKRSEIFP